ncbi:Uncharacterised protein [Vibrio cholerae]|nr:Uncharacterised protein [Vibrio cholerae]
MFARLDSGLCTLYRQRTTSLYRLRQSTTGYEEQSCHLLRRCQTQARQHQHQCRQVDRDP